jgi:hypothetical protein
MEYFKTIDTVGIRTIKNNNIIQIELNKENDILSFADGGIIIININESQLIIDREYIYNNITPNFTVEMLYYVLCNFIKYDNFNFELLVEESSYILEGCYHEPYDQGDEIFIRIKIE